MASKIPTEGANYVLNLIKTDLTGGVYIGLSTGAPSWVASTVYAVGDFVGNNSNIYKCITAGTSASSGGPTTTDADITDGTAHWQYIVAGSAIAAGASLAACSEVSAATGSYARVNVTQANVTISTNQLTIAAGALPVEFTGFTNTDPIFSAFIGTSSDNTGKLLAVGSLTTGNRTLQNVADKLDLSPVTFTLLP